MILPKITSPECVGLAVCLARVLFGDNGVAMLPWEATIVRDAPGGEKLVIQDVHGNYIADASETGAGDLAERVNELQRFPWHQLGYRVQQLLAGLTEDQLLVLVRRAFVGTRQGGADRLVMHWTPARENSRDRTVSEADRRYMVVTGTRVVHGLTRPQVEYLMALVGLVYTLDLLEDDIF